MKKHFIVALISTIFFSSAHAHWATRILPHALFSTDILQHMYFKAYRMPALKKEFREVTDTRILSFMRQECKKITQKEIRVFYGPLQSFGLLQLGIPVFTYENDIFITSADYITLTTIFAKPELSESDEKTLSIFKFVFQHEASHIKHNDTHARTALSVFGAISRSMLYELAYPHMKKNWQKICLYIGLNTVYSQYTAYINRAQEYRADSEVVGTDALEGGCIFCNHFIEINKNSPAGSLVDALTLTHPQLKTRLEALQKRLNDAQNN